MKYGSGFGLGYVLGNGKGADLSFTRIVLGGLGWSAIAFAGAAVLMSPIIYLDAKETNAELKKLNTTIAASLDYQETNVTDFKCEISKEEDFLFEFSGNAINSHGDDIDFFSCAYKVNATQYQEIHDYLIKQEKEDRSALSSAMLLRKITEIVSTAELVNKEEQANVATSSKNDDTVILNVSQAKVEGDKVCYYVAHLQEGKNKKGQLGLTTILTEVSYDLTDELKANPNGVFALPKEQAKAKAVAKSFEPIDKLQVKSYRGR